SYRVDLPLNLRRRGVHDVFHSSLLRIHEPNDDRLFPGRLESQVGEFDEPEEEWAIEKVLTHSGKGASALFQVLWKSGDRTWLPLNVIEGRPALQAYLEAV
ncbi:hypothetical protein OH77DRAFT_1369116, partial [Trametes cingulata]